MTRHENKIQEAHLCRRACVYVRQSTLVQVHEHQESTRRQYEMYQRAHQLGWMDAQIEVIDEDLGRSASDASQTRTGFQKLLGKVVTGEVGAIFSVEISRLARQDSEGHRLVEVAALTETLLIDEQQVYDPRLSDDRLMLGLKVLLSSNEIRLMGQRLRENQFRKAQRGELHLNLPVGLVFVPHAGIQLDPDEQVQGAVRLLFERFRLSGHVSAVAKYFYENGLLFPRRKGTWYGQLEWSPLSIVRVRAVLDNPLYAGAYVYGRSKRCMIVRDQDQIKRPRLPLPQNEWAVAHWDAFKGYISREEYEANQAYLVQNRAKPHIPGSWSRRRDGHALLTGKIVCGRCGRPMHVGYQGTNGSRSVYVCNSSQLHHGETACQRMPGKAIDEFVSARLLAALTPAQIELSLALIEELERQQVELNQQWQRRIEAARYAANLAQRRYEQVDPANRLVARSLEQQWEACLQEVSRLEVEFTAFGQKKPQLFHLEQRHELLRLASDLPKVWLSPTTTWTERKNLLELLIADVTLTRLEAGITVQIRWFTNEVETGQLPLPVRQNRPTPASLVERVRQLNEQYRDREIAEILNREGIKTSHGNAFNAKRVEMIRRHNGISNHSVQP
jgi:DNA invertase Pin-like site-specific DNA recombinase